MVLTSKRLILYFNPRSHERSDILPVRTRTGSSEISIHAPTRGATTNGATFLLPFLFQSTLPREERRSSAIFKKSSALFQSTLPREERRKNDNLCKLSVYFNPRSHERSDVLLSAKKQALRNFNPRSHERSDLTLQQHYSTAI